MLTGRHGDRLDTWLAAVRAEDLPHLRTFANGLKRDHAAVLAGLTLPYSSGAVEGKVCKIKFLKRLMFGRANYDLLQKDGPPELMTQRDHSPPSAPDPFAAGTYSSPAPAPRWPNKPYWP